MENIKILKIVNMHKIINDVSSQITDGSMLFFLLPG